MCYSAESSMQYYSVTILICIALFAMGDRFDRFIATFFFVVIQMQLAEYLMWIDQSCHSTNKYGTYYAYFALMLQPLIVLLGGAYVGLFKPSHLKYVYGFVGILLLIWVSKIGRYVWDTYTPSSPVCSKSVKGHLLWDFLKRPEYQPTWPILVTYFIGFFIPWLFMIRDQTRAIFMCLLLVFSFIWHYYKFGNQWHTMWCSGTRIGAILYVLFTVARRLPLFKKILP